MNLKETKTKKQMSDDVVKVILLSSGRGMESLTGRRVLGVY